MGTDNTPSAEKPTQQRLSGQQRAHVARGRREAARKRRMVQTPSGYVPKPAGSKAQRRAAVWNRDYGWVTGWDQFAKSA